MIKRKVLFSSLFSLVGCLVLAEKAYAYLDLGTSGYIVQILTTSILGAIYFLREYLHKVKLFFKQLFRRKS